MTAPVWNHPAWNHVEGMLIQAGDYCLGWSLGFPRDVTLVMFVALTTLLTLGVRRWGTDQDRLRRCQADLRRLRELQSEARAEHDEESSRRVSRTAMQVRLVQLRADLKTLLIVIVPLGGMTLWAAERIAFQAIQRDQSFEIVAKTARSSIGGRAHLVPVDGIELDSAAIMVVEADDRDKTHGVARWRVKFAAKASPGAVTLTIRHAGESVEHPVLLGNGRYLNPQRDHAGDRLIATQVLLDEHRFLGVVPGVPWLGLAPWSVAYLIGCLGGIPLGKRVLGIA